MKIGCFGIVNIGALASGIYQGLSASAGVPIEPLQDLDSLAQLLIMVGPVALNGVIMDFTSKFVRIPVYNDTVYTGTISDMMNTDNFTEEYKDLIKENPHLLEEQFMGFLKDPHRNSSKDSVEIYREPIQTGPPIMANRFLTDAFLKGAGIAIAFEAGGYVIGRTVGAVFY